MKKQKKSATMDERQKRLLMYLSLLAAAVFLAFYNPGQLWLVIGLGVGVLYGLANDWIFSRKKAKTPENQAELSTKIQETVENKTTDDEK